MTERLLSVDDVAERLQCSSGKARQIMRRLAHVRVGKLLRIREAVLEKWITGGGNDFFGSHQRVRVRESDPLPARERFAALEALKKDHVVRTRDKHGMLFPRVFELPVDPKKKQSASAPSAPAEVVTVATPTQAKRARWKSPGVFTKPKR